MMSKADLEGDNLIFNSMQSVTKTVSGLQPDFDICLQTSQKLVAVETAVFAPLQTENVDPEKAVKPRPRHDISNLTLSIDLGKRAAFIKKKEYLIAH